MVSIVQLKLRGFSIVQDQWKQIDKNTAGNIFTQFLSAVQNFFGDLISSFNNIFPSADQIHHMLDVISPYLLAAVVLILVVCCLIFFLPFVFCIFGILFSCISSILGILFSCIATTVSFLFRCISATVVFLFRSISTTVKFLFRCISTTVCFIFSGLKKCLCFGASATEKMMVAPGRAPLMIARAAFEASPRAYFAGLRMLS